MLKTENITVTFAINFVSFQVSLDGSDENGAIMP